MPKTEMCEKDSGSAVTSSEGIIGSNQQMASEEGEEEVVCSSIRSFSNLSNLKKCQRRCQISVEPSSKNLKPGDDTHCLEINSESNVDFVRDELCSIASKFSPQTETGHEMTTVRDTPPTSEDTQTSILDSVEENSDASIAKTETASRSSKRTRRAPKRYFAVENISNSKRVPDPLKAKRSRLCKSKTDLTPSPEVHRAEDSLPSACESFQEIDNRDPLEEDLSISSIEVQSDVSSVPKPDYKSRSPSSSSLSSTGPSSPRVGKKSRNSVDKNQTSTAVIGSEEKTLDQSTNVLNGISPRKVHKKFGKFQPTSGLQEVSSDVTDEMSEEKRFRDASPIALSMKVKSRWRLSVEQESTNFDRDERSLDLPGDNKLQGENFVDVKSNSISTEEADVEVKQRLASFDHITENVFLCERRYNKESRGMDCDCTLSKEDLVKGRKGCGNDCLNRLLFIECGKSCSLGKRCSNRRFQNCENAPTEVFKTNYKGFGVRATQDIPKDTFILEYVGEVLDPKQFRRRARKYASDDVQHFYFMALSSEFFIDASSKGNISRFINHSCDPNAETQKWTVDGELRVGFFSKRVIKKGEEITFDYKYERYGQEAQKCFCGAKTCRGWLGGEPDKENRKPEVDSDDDYWSSTSSEEEVVGKLPFTTSQSGDAISSAVRVNKQLSRPKQLRRKRHLRPTRKIKDFDDQEYAEEIEMLQSTGVRTKTHTVELCRLMVRVTDLHTKLELVNLIRTADTPCRRLFLDYHGLKLLNAWMSVLGNTLPELELKLKIEDTLSSLTIPHKTMLVDSKIWQTLTRWSNPEQIFDSSAQSSRAASPYDPKSKLASCTELPQSAVTADEANAPKIDGNGASIDVKVEPVNEPADRTGNNSINEVLDIGNDKEVVETEADVQTEAEVYRSDGDNAEATIFPKLENDSEKIIEAISSQNVDNQDLGFENVDEGMDVGVKPVAKPDVPTKDVSVMPEPESATLVRSRSSIETELSENLNQSSDPEREEKLQTVRAKATALLSQWSNLQEVFKIPKKELLALRTAHEQEVDRAAAAANSATKSITPRSQTKASFQSAYERTSSRTSRPDSPTKREPRVSRFDDRTGLLNAPNLTREQRRQFFEMKAAQEQEEKRKRMLLQQQHENKCYFLRLDPAITPMFPQHPDFYYDPELSQWHQMPEPYPVVNVDWGYPGMALLKLEAFREGDPPLPDPAFIYPPGVVPVSYCFGHPMALDPSLLPVPPPLPPMPPPVDLDEIPLPQRATMDGSSPNKKLIRPDCAPDMKISLEDPVLNGFDHNPVSDLARYQANQNLKYLTDVDSLPPKERSENECQTRVVMDEAVSTNEVTSNGKKVEKVEIRVILPRYWRIAQDPDGRTYFYHKITRQTQWRPPTNEEDPPSTDAAEDVAVVEMETASSDSECGDDSFVEDGQESDDEDEDDSDKEDDEENGNSIVAKILAPPNPENAIFTSSGDVIYSDLSTHEKELLLKSSRKKSKEERQNERRFKRERDREKREYERKRRRERHGKHRRDGLVQEYFIPRRTDRDKTDLMSFKELKDRLANRAQIIEEQELEELAEMERERSKRQEQEKRAKELAKRAKMEQAKAELSRQMEAESSSRPTAAAADTSSEVVKKIKDRFLKEASKAVVKYLDPYRKQTATQGHIQNVDDFKHLARKLTNYLLAKEQQRCKRIEDLKFSESVKKKSADFVRKYMTKFDKVYERSPN